VEYDNLDSYTRSQGYLSKANMIAFAKMLVSASKKFGMFAAQKNLSELGTQGRDEIGFAFAIAEECYRWDSCKAYVDVYGDQVIDIEYTDDLRESFSKICASKHRPKATILRDRKLLKQGENGYAYKRC
ncbi:MAG: endo alpha-1,4 polygalactosaminidase, partial [Alphaproteobacteria bacterium]|nr:endo alpha-1,4 polygalactosaminidase [Alphaproteobacteria bacterium]